MDVGGSNRREGGNTRRPKGGGSTEHGSTPRNGRRTSTDNSLAFIFPSDYEQGHEIQKQILHAAQKHGFAGESFYALRIALEEALVNAIKHGNRLDPHKKVKVQAKVSPNRAEIMVEDEGAGFDRRSVPDPTADENLERCSGRGILLIEAYMSEVKWDRGGRRLRMVRENRT